MEKFGYMLQTPTWTGHYVWLDRMVAERMAEQMNKDRKKAHLKPNVEVKVVEITDLPF